MYEKNQTEIIRKGLLTCIYLFILFIPDFLTYSGETCCELYLEFFDRKLEEGKIFDKLFRFL